MTWQNVIVTGNSWYYVDGRTLANQTYDYYVPRLVDNTYLVTVAIVGQRARVVIAPLRAAHGGVDPGGAAIHAHLNVLTRSQFSTERAVQGVGCRAGQEVVIVEAGIHGDVIHAHRDRRIRGHRVNGDLLMDLAERDCHRQQLVLRGWPHAG